MNEVHNKITVYYGFNIIQSEEETSLCMRKWYEPISLFFVFKEMKS